MLTVGVGQIQVYSWFEDTQGYQHPTAKGTTWDSAHQTHSFCTAMATISNPQIIRYCKAEGLHSVTESVLLFWEYCSASWMIVIILRTV